MLDIDLNGNVKYSFKKLLYYYLFLIKKSELSFMTVIYYDTVANKLLLYTIVFSESDL